MRPSLDELRARAHPPGLLDRHSGEHWAGRLYMRRVSLRVTRQLVDAPVSPNQLTLIMLGVGVGAAAVAAVPGVATALACVLLIQLYLLLDCVDGEVARWRGATSALGVYLDRLGHYAAEMSLGVAVGLRAFGFGWQGLAVGCLAALGMVAGKIESDLVAVARPDGPPLDDEEAARSRVTLLATLRGLVARFPFHRLVGAVELSLAVLVTSLVDVVLGDDRATVALAVALVVIAWVVALLHPIMIATSKRLR